VSKSFTINKAVHTIVNRLIPFCCRNDHLLAAGSDLRRGNKIEDEAIALRQVVVYVWRTALVCAAFCLCQGRCEERQQLYQAGALISQRMFKPNGNSDYLSISERHLRLIQCQDRIPSDDPDCFQLLNMTMPADRSSGWNLYDVDAGEWVVGRCQEPLHMNARKTSMFMPFSRHEIRHARQRVQFISIPPHTLSDWPVI